MKKVAIVTGATRGIGLGISTAFLQQGYKVALCYGSDHDNAKATLKQLNTKDAILIHADISDANQRQSILDKTQQAWGSCDVLVNNAGIIRKGRFLDIEADVFETVMNTNFYGPLYLAQQFSHHLIKNNKPGAIVNIITMGIHKPSNIAYGTSKSALHYASRCMARELAQHHIRVNSVSPGMVATNLNSWSRESGSDVWDKMEKTVPLKRAASADEIAQAVTFLCSDKASYITGQELIVDGGIIG